MSRKRESMAMVQPEVEDGVCSTKRGEQEDIVKITSNPFLYIFYIFIFLMC